MPGEAKDVRDWAGAGGTVVGTICELCGFTGEMAVLYPAKGIVKCAACGLVFFAGEVETASLYTKDYFFGEEYRDYFADEPALRKNFRRRLGELRRFAPSGRLLEIGCAYGLFLDEARGDYDVRGLDIASEAVEHARATLGLDVMAADFLDLPDEPESCDVICMWDVLEHLERPVRTIETACRWLRPGGVFAATTNDVDSFVARFRKAKWRQIHPPTHLYYFSAATLDRAVRQSGLEPVHLSYVGNHRSYRSMLHSMIGGRKKTAWLYRLLTLGGRLDLSIRLNLGDIMMLVARKPPGGLKDGRSSSGLPQEVGPARLDVVGGGVRAWTGGASEALGHPPAKRDSDFSNEAPFCLLPKPTGTPHRRSCRWYCRASTSRITSGR